MAEEAAAIEADADAPMINVAEPEAPQEDAPIPVHEQPQDEMQSSDDDDGPLERPDYYPAKFWDEDGPDVEKLAKSYAELEKKFKSGKHKAPEQYDISSLADGLRKTGLARMPSRILPVASYLWQRMSKRVSNTINALKWRS
jgi:hypothetical protein